MEKARIIRSARREFDCRLTELGETVKATAKGNLLKEGDLVVGDYIFLEKTDGTHWVIANVEDRKNSIFRRVIREQSIKTVASNIDLMVIVCAVSKPKFKQGLIDRYLVRAEQWSIPAVVVFNKMDEFKEQFDLSFEKERLEFMEIPYLETCALDQASLQDLLSYVKHKTSIFMGQSGVGKSKLISALSGGDIELESQKLAKVGKGAHTTTWAELVHFENFEIIDSPGVRTLSIEDIASRDFDELFPDLIPYFQECQFNNCEHTEASKGCFFFNGEYDYKEIVLSRLASYLRMKGEIGKIPDWDK